MSMRLGQLKHGRACCAVLRLMVIAVAALRTGGCAISSQADRDLPQPPREFRGVWVASVSNIDWPSRRGLTVEQQRQELTAILDRAAALNFNAVILQVRAAGDALYPSQLEPWSIYLTGESGRGPEPAYDPLAVAIEEAHQRGLQLHAWINPFRAAYAAQEDKLAPQHIAMRRPDLIRRYGKMLWLDPGEPEAVNHTLNVALDIVRRYDVDGIHIDDYFYPYPVHGDDGKTAPFPDDDSYARYCERGGRLARDDWRRDNVNRFVMQLYFRVKRARPQVQVGISPFGIWRPGHPPQIKGMDQYGVIYADVRKWLREGWCDYLVPQLYWPIANPDQSFVALLQWWASQNVRGRHIWPGMSIARVGGTSPRSVPIEEIHHQVRWTRWLVPDAPGVVLFSFKHLQRDTDGQVLGDELRDAVFSEPALVPESPWLRGSRPLRPVILRREIRDGQILVDLAPPGGDVLRRIVCIQQSDRWQMRILPPTATHVAVDHPVTRLVIRDAGRLGQLGPPAYVD